MNTPAPLKQLFPATNQASSLVANYVAQNKPEQTLSRERYLQDNTAWSDLESLSMNVLQLLTKAPGSIANFFGSPDIFAFVPKGESAKAQAAIITLTNTIAPILSSWNVLRAKHEGRSGALTDINDIDLMVFATSEYHNLAEQFNGLSEDVMNYLYGVMATTEANIIAVQKHQAEQAASAEQTN